MSKRLADTAATADSVKELLTKNQSLMSPELYSALLEAVQQVENSTNATITLDGASPAYKAFAKKVEVRQFFVGPHARECKIVCTSRQVACD